MKLNQTVKFQDWECIIELKQNQGRNDISLYDQETYELIAVASVQLPDLVDPKLVAIKDYSENQGMLEALTKAGVVSAPLSYIPSGFVEIPICMLLV